MPKINSEFLLDLWGQGVSREEIAERTGHSMNAVSKAIWRLRKKGEPRASKRVGESERTISNYRWSDEGKAQVRDLAEEGLTVKQAAERMGMGVGRLYSAAERFGIRFAAHVAPCVELEEPKQVPDTPWPEALYADEVQNEVVSDHIRRRPMRRQPWTSIIDRVPDPLLAVRAANRRPAVADTALPG